MQQSVFQQFLEFIIYWSGTLNGILWTYIVIPFIIFLGIYFSIKTRFIQFRLFIHAFRLVTGKQKKSELEGQGISALQALLTALGARIGGGNLAGVGIALYMGGPGALFWMVLIALLMMVLAMFEVTLGQMYKVSIGEQEDNRYISGPPHYMEKGLGYKWAPIIFSICIATQMAAWNGLQASYLDAYFTNILGTEQSFNSIFLILVLGSIIIGGSSWIVKICEKVVPVMAIFYFVLAIYVILSNFSALPSLLLWIFRSGLGLESLIGGVTGWSISAAISNGVRRGIYSNEAGVGSMSTIGGLSNVNHPTKQGVVDSFGVFLDTVILCSATGLIILTSGVLSLEGGGQKDLGGLLIQKAFNYHFGSWAGYYLIFTFFTFSLTTIIANYMMGEVNLRYIGLKYKVRLHKIYKLIVIGIIGYGSVSSVSGIVHIADILMGLSVTLNLISLFRLRNRAYETIQDYEKQFNELKGTRREPVFSTDQTDLSSLWRNKKGYNKYKYL